MSWPERTIGSALSGHGARHLGRDIYDRTLAIGGKGTTWNWGEVSTDEDDYTTLATTVVRVPGFVRAGDSIKVTAVVSRVGGGDGEFRIREATTGTVGTEEEVTGTDVILTSALVVPDDTWASTDRTLELQARTPGAGTVTVSSVGVLANLRYGA